MPGGKALKLCQLVTILQGHSEFPDLPTSKCASPYLNCFRSTNSARLTPPFTHTTLFQNSMIKLWNMLPLNICTLQSLPHFKHAGCVYYLYMLCQLVLACFLFLTNKRNEHNKLIMYGVLSLVVATYGSKDR